MPHIAPTEVSLASVPVERLAAVLDRGRIAELVAAGARVRKSLDGRVIWHVNSTSSGGGVAEMLHPLLAYGRGEGIDVRWLVIGGDARFFEITKRVHHGIHGRQGSPGPLGDDERRHVEHISRANFDEMRALVRRGDIVVCHDPQTAFLVPLLVHHGVSVVWRCHIGTEHDNEWTARAWSFLAPVDAGHRFVFSRAAYIPERLADRAVVIPPSIDPLSPKNRPLTELQVREILGHIGVLRVENVTGPTFERADGTPRRVDHVADVVAAGPMAGPEVPMVVQVSRWDPLKDMAGVMHAFAEHVADGVDAQLVLAGPNVSGVADDPEGAAVLDDCITQWRHLPHECRSRIVLTCLPMSDAEENAVMVNALQRHAAVVVQKSLEEGFGLTVAEAMWKARPVIASRVGGIQDQVVDGVTGVLIEPTDEAALGRALGELLVAPERAAAMGAAGQERVRARFLGDRHLLQYEELLIELAGGGT